ncbi:hypothetical protein PAMP_019638 [Pampus punctatissimus]
MALQGVVTPGRTRRLILKLPVGTLRRNSGERSESVNPSTAQSVSVTANVFHWRPQFFKVAGKSRCGSAVFECSLFACHCQHN